tara:strand:+ start:4988 stop:5356 length:369 start_codon:yes stop_codon:yes gene_type:complete
MHPPAQPIDPRLLSRIPLVLAQLVICLILVSGLVMAQTRTLDQRAITIQSPQYLVNINTDDLGDLMLLPGIGKTIASRIINHRQTHGPFASLDDLVAISGISFRTVARLKPYLMPITGKSNP